MWLVHQQTSHINKRGLIMTVGELYSSVAQLGFETALDSMERFYYAVNRALLQVNRIKPLTAIYTLNHFPLENLLKGDYYSPIYKGKEDLVFMVENAKSYSFECNGNGSMVVEKIGEEDEWETVTSVNLVSNGQFKHYRGFIKDGDVFVEGTFRVRFIGSFVYYVQNLAFYGDLISNNVSDIPPYGKYIPYDIASSANDFIEFAYPPIMDATRGEGFTLNRDYFVEGEGKILIPASTKGVFEICYKRVPKQIDSNTYDNESIDLDEELCAILPNLVASYIWVEDEPDKAQYYLSLYREQVAEIIAQKKDMRPSVYRNKTGW
jgi:hypothetical protein